MKTASGAIAVQIARPENRRDVVMEHLGSAHTDAEVAVVLALSASDSVTTFKRREGRREARNRRLRGLLVVRA